MRFSIQNRKSGIFSPAGTPDNKKKETRDSSVLCLFFYRFTGVKSRLACETLAPGGRVSDIFPYARVLHPKNLWFVGSLIENHNFL